MALNFFTQEFVSLSIFFLCSLSLALLILITSFIVSTSIPDSEKLSAYECGFDPYEDARNTFDVRFYIIALLFLIFDLETVFFLPFSVSLSFLTISGFAGMLDFILELVVGLVYAWVVGALSHEVC
jgi:NADH:ubiquinone oxidoreductase subunit 3 (subunit A)